MSGRELDALGLNQHEPTPYSRNRVRMHAFNRVAHEIIARILRIPVAALRYHYWEELELTEHEILALAAQNVLALANQTKDLNTALRANETLLRTRSPHWREPRPLDPAPAELPAARLEHMTLEQVEAELARIGIGTVAGTDQPAAAARPADPAGQGKPE
jgi:hypothetical protein